MNSANVTKRHLRYEESIEANENELRSEFAHVNEENDKEFYERMLHIPGAKIIFYMHGNSGSRAASHRVELYNVLRAQGYHVIAFDYRGYGDSLPNSPTETGLVNDAIAVYKYIQSVTKNPVFGKSSSYSRCYETMSFQFLHFNYSMGTFARHWCRLSHNGYATEAQYLWTTRARA